MLWRMMYTRPLRPRTADVDRIVKDTRIKHLVRYCLFGWGVPAIAVSIFVIIDQILSKGLIGYGEGEAYCFISKPEAVLCFFVGPAALIMLFNAFALVHTVLHIVKTRKRTQEVTNQRHSTGVALIFVKMASVTGVTWILGIVANVKALSFLWYPYVILNSLQGNILATASASMPSKPSPAIPELLPSTLPIGGLPDEASYTVPSSDPQFLPPHLQPLPSSSTDHGEAIRSFLMTSIGWNCTPSIEAYFHSSKEVVIQVDSSKHGIEAVLLQEGRPIEYASRALTPPERKWTQIVLV
ncbi:adhesion G-protein coupled receptor D1-like [Montipora capricornis]|uniref:adhesion G-protein coupled receptor D1-like n=1 Tax=Montipora capricornis TaxID=246305 RepID=UPI0035F1A38C